MFLLRPSIQSLVCIRFNGKIVFIIHLLFSEVVLRLHFLFPLFEFSGGEWGDPFGLYGEKRKLFLSIPCPEINFACILVYKIHLFVSFLGKKVSVLSRCTNGHSRSL